VEVPFSGYIIAEKDRQKKMNIDVMILSTSNKSLAENGAKIVEGTLSRYVSIFVVMPLG
jgi:hypothetical protein